MLALLSTAPQNQGVVEEEKTTMTVYSCDCNRFDDVDPYSECPNNVPGYLHNLSGENERKKFREIKDKCEFKGELGKDE